MKRRLLAGLLTCIMLFSLLPAAALADEDGEELTGEVAEAAESATKESVTPEGEEPDTYAAAPKEVEKKPGVLAEGNVAKIGETEYATLDKAVAAVKDGETIELLTDCQSNLTAAWGINKNVTIKGEYTVIFNTYSFGITGEHTLILDGCKIVIKDAAYTAYSDNPSNAAIMLDEGATLTLDNGASLVIDNATGDGIATWTDAESSFYETINVLNNSSYECKNCGGSGIVDYGAASTPIDQVNVTGNSYIYCHDNYAAFTNTLNITVEQSRVDALHNRGNGSNGTNFTIVAGSEVNFNDNGAHGLSASNLLIENSTVTSERNGANGIHVSGTLSIDNQSNVTIADNKCSISSTWTIPGALYIAGTSSIANSTVIITGNSGSGIYQKAGTLNVADSASVTITNNEAVKLGFGGGVYVNGTMNLPDNIDLYNNHADTAGDDIYNLGTIAFGRVGSDWYLDGDPDCTDKIDGWYDDSDNSDGNVENGRWEAHAEDESQRHIVLVSPPAGYAATGLLALKAAHGYIEPAPIVPQWETSKSKAATKLEKNAAGEYTSDVTLSLPAAESKPITDVVFVLDRSSSSTAAAAKNAINTMLENLAEIVKTSDATINVGVVGFDYQAYTVLNLTKLTEDNLEKIKTAVSDKTVSGTNIQAGIEAGTAMLEGDTDVDGSNKYLVLLTDGISHAWTVKNDDGTTEVMTLWGAGTVEGPNDVRVFNGANSYPYTGFDTTKISFADIYAFSESADQLHSLYEVPVYRPDGVLLTDADLTNSKSIYYGNYIHIGEYDKYLSGTEKGVYTAAHAYADAASKYKCISLYWTNSSYPVAVEFMNWTATLGKAYDISNAASADFEDVFENIQRDILYLLDAGSKVVDVIGEGVHDTNKYYDFDLVNSASNLTLKVGDAVYTTTKVENGLDEGETAQYTFTYSYQNDEGKTVELSATNDAKAPFILHYYKNGATAAQTGDKAISGECFVWDINVPVCKDATVQLIYTVKLTNPQTTIGTYGEYDADGIVDETKGTDKEMQVTLDGLYTNKSATLYPIDSDGNEVQPEDFFRPCVSYEVTNEPTGTLYVTKYVLDSSADLNQKFSFKVTVGDANQEFELTAGETKAITGLTVGATYAVEETNSRGYVDNHFNATGTISGSRSGDTAVVINVPADECALFISKTVKNSSTTQEFTFTVTLTGADGNPLPGTYSYSYTNSDTVGEFKSGDTVKLASGNSVVIYGLPAKTQYKIVETAVSNYTASSVTTGVVGTDNDATTEGTIDAGVVKGVHYTNTYSGGGGGSSGGGGGSSVLNTDDHYSYIIGYKDGYLRPYGTITRGEVATIFFRLLTDEARDKYWSQTNNYSDCNSELWCNNAISTLSNMGIIDGYTDGTFRPYGKITRAQFAKIAVGFFETTKKEYQGYYSDVPENAWFTDYVEAASRVGLIQGFQDGTFRPNTNITRAQACVIVNRALDRKPDEDHLLPERKMITWPDNNPGDWFYADMQEATNSHDYTWLSKGSEKKYMEDWTKKLEQRNWAAFEHAWSTAHSAPGGEVVK